MGMDYIVDIFEDMDDACEDAVEWLRESSYPTLQEAWDACPRGDWMLWLILRCTDSDPKTLQSLILLSYDCVELGRPMWRPEDVEELQDVLKTVRAWVCGETPTAEVEEQWYALYGTYLNGSAVEVVQQVVLATENPWYAFLSAYIPLYMTNYPNYTILQKAASIVRQYFPTAPSLK